MEFQNAIKQYKSPVDEKGGCRTYAILSSEDKFVLHVSSWTLRDIGGTAVGTMHEQKPFDTLAEAVELYEDYLDKWEDGDGKS